MALVLSLTLATAVLPMAILVAAGLVAWRRVRLGQTVAVPAVVAVLGLVLSFWVVLTMLTGVGSLWRHTVDGAKKATILSVGISEALNIMAFVLLVSVPLLLVGWLVDRRLSGRHRIAAN
jgi:hypothetical protein